MEELIEYIVVNKDLKMSPGKIAAQVGHVCTICAHHYITNLNKDWNNKFLAWFEKDQKKIVLEGHQKDLEKLISLNEDRDFSNKVFFIKDNGLTEIPAGSLTAVSLGIMTREEAKPYTKRLQLLK